MVRLFHRTDRRQILPIVQGRAGSEFMNRHADRMSPASRTVLWCGLISCAVVCWLSLLGVSPACAAEEVERSRSRELAVGLPLPPRANGREGVTEGRPRSTSSSASIWTTVIALGSIVGVLTLVGRWLKPYVGAPRGLPIEALELLGRRQIEPKVAVHLVRCGGRVLVLGVSADGVRTLSEITDPIEVERLTETCLSERDVRRSSFSARTASPRETAAHPSVARPPEPRLATFGRGGEAHHE